jgi:tetratricopeptide (TPR) repeat protein
VNRRDATAHYSLRRLQSLLGVSRRVLAGLIDAGFVTPSRGPRNELRFGFQDVVILRTAFQLQSADIPSRKLLRALEKLRKELPDEAPLSGMRITAVGSTVAVRTGPSQWEVDSGQLLLDFEVAPINGDVTFLDSAPRRGQTRKEQAAEWFALAEQLAHFNDSGAEQAYRKVLELSPEPHWPAYVNLGALLCQVESRCADALAMFDEALRHFPNAALLHFNRAVVLEELDRLAEAETAYLRCLEMDPQFEDAAYNLSRLMELAGDHQASVRHMSAFLRSTS